jgi:predicted ATP-binding protein involved in virulence
MVEPVYFLNLEIENYRCFKEKQTLDLSDGNGNWKKWTIILGDNGTGKSSLLELLAGTEIIEMGQATLWPKLPYTLKLLEISDDYIKNRGLCYVGVNIFSEPPAESTNTIQYQFDKNDLVIKKAPYDRRLLELKCFGYGANRKMGPSLLAKLMDGNSETLFDENARLINAEEWLLQLDYAASKDSDVKNFAIDKRDQVKQILIDLLPDINDIKFTLPTKENLKTQVEFETSFGWVSVQQLSLGYKTMIAWMVDLAARMLERYPDSINPLAEPAIVLVDEIDLHLHPKWQRKIFDYLSDKFPQTQFIVTAHSPLIVQSAPQDANIVLLRKEGDHVVIDNDLKSVQNWRLDQILTSDLFGLGSARGKEAEEKLQERQELLSKGKLSKKEQERLNELNSFANRLPTAYNYEDIEAMSIVQEAAEYLKKQKK